MLGAPMGSRASVAILPLALGLVLAADYGTRFPRPERLQSVGEIAFPTSSGKDRNFLWRASLSMASS